MGICVAKLPKHIRYGIKEVRLDEKHSNLKNESSHSTDTSHAWLDNKEWENRN